MKTVIRNSYTPKVGDYCETIVVDKESQDAYIFDCDGVFTPMPQPVDVDDILRRAAEYTDETVAPLEEKLDTIEEGAQVNVIETITQNGQPLTVTDKTVNVTVPTKTSDLENDGSDGTDTYVESSTLDDYYTKSETDTQIGYETDAREIADSGLQEQIDAIVASSDVVDIVGTYAALQAYDTSKLHDNDIIKVLTDETRDDATTYYRWDTDTSTWSYIGAEGPFYTKAESDALFTPMTRTVNGKALTTDIILTAADVHALPDSTVIPTVNDATLTIQKNGTNVATFTANSASNQTANITVPVDTSDLTNDGDGQSPFATEDYVDLNGGKIDTIEVNGTAQPIVNKTVDITVPTKTSDLTNDGSDGTDTYVEAGDLATVATSGDYDDLTNKPTIPTVNDATLTIQKNGTDVATFTANSSTNQTANITVPTDTADLTNGAGFITSSALSNYYTKSETYSQGEVNNLINSLSIPTKTSDLTNDSGFISEDDLYSEVCGSGTTITFQDAPEAPLSDFKLKGETSQNGTPAPDAPVPVKVVTGENVVKITGKNLLKLTQQATTSNGITATLTNGIITYSGTASSNWANIATRTYNSIPAGTYTLSMQETFTTNYAYALSVTYTDNTTATFECWKSVSNKRTVTFTKDVASYYVYLTGLSSGTSYSGTISMMLEKNSDATNFEPYQEQSYPLSLGSLELCKIGGYQDSIYKSDGKWYVRKRVVPATLSSTEFGVYFDMSRKRVYYQASRLFGSQVVYPADNDQIAPVMSTHFTALSATNVLASMDGVAISSSGYISFRDNSQTTEQGFKDWIDSNLPKAYAVLATPTDTEITNEALIEQLEAILSQGHTYAGTTNITTVIAAGNEQGELEICYTKTILPIATETSLGMVRIGSGLSITENGVLSATGGGGGSTDWDDITNKPTNVSYWTNDAGYITSAAIPTNVSSFTNDAGYITSAAIPTNVSAFTNDAGYLTSSTLSNYYTKSETYNQSQVNALINSISVPTKTSDLTNDGSDGTSTYVEADDLAAVATSGSYNDLSNKPTIPTIVDMTGATSSAAGAHGYAPAPAAGDNTKFLRGDGTWATPADEIYTAGDGINIDANNEISVDATVVATQTDLAGKQDTLTAGSNMTISNNVISAKVDSALSASSANPVQNSVVKAALDGKATGSITKASGGTLGTTTINSTTANYMEATKLSTATDLNTIKTTGVYIIAATPTNSPTGAWGTMYVDWTAGMKYQVYINDGVSGNIFKRSWDSSNSTWTSWIRITSADIANIERFYRGLVPLGTAIAANKNLNTTEFLKVGKYYCSTDAAVATLTNCPTNRAFMMEVFSPLSTTIDNETTSAWVYRVRILTTYMGKMYIQRANSSSTAGTFTYGAWEEFAYSSGIGNATLTIQKNGTNVQTFTANATSNKTANITVPTKTSDLTNDGSDGGSTYVEADQLATVAASGSYNDLTDKPTIPTVNDATLTIQKNGTNVQTFTANSSSNKVANIQVPNLQTSNTDPGEGSTLAADTFLGIYDIAPEDVDGSRLINNTVTWAKIAQATMPKAKIAELNATNGSFTATDKGILIINEQFQANAANTDSRAQISFSGASGTTVTPRASQRGAQYARNHVFGLALVDAGDSVTWTVTYTNTSLPAYGADGGFSLFIPCNW